MAGRVRLALVWHMHQPGYRDALTDRVLLPWTRLHATKDYRDMASILRRFPRVRATFNLTPSLLDGLEALAAGGTDDYLDIARRPSASLDESERRFVLSRFFSANRERMIDAHPPYVDLYRRVEAAAGVPPSPETAERIPPDALDTGALRDLAVWFHLAWVDPSYRDEEPIRSLLGKGGGFTEEEKGALLDWGLACSASVVGEYDALSRSGQVELITGALHHPILPLVVDTDAPREVSSGITLPVPPFRAREDAAEQLRRARDAHARRFGRAPRGTWPPEGAVSDAALALIAGAGFEWAASDETVLGAALEAGGRPIDWPAALYRPYRVETSAGPLSLVFRDRAISDLIGFAYRHWEAGPAADDFLARVRLAASAAGDAVEIPLVTVILDGENCWEAYPDDGAAFLEALYGRLEAAADIETVTVSEALERGAPRASLSRVPVGSWIRPDLGIWVGSPQKNRAWQELRLARDAVSNAGARGLAPASVDAAMEEIYAAEGSDWFWWYGEDHPSVHRGELDRLFRTHLIRAYALAGEAAPDSLGVSLRADEARTEASAGRAGSIRVRPTLDGVETDFFEWRDAVRHVPGGDSGTMHRAAARLAEVRFGTDSGSLWIRVDVVASVLGADRRGGVSGELSLRVSFPPPRGGHALLPLLGGRGAPAWSGEPGETSPSSDPGEYAIDRIVEVRLPLARIGASPGETLRFRVALEGGGAIEETAPESGWLGVEVRDERSRSADWSAL